jgi:predicted GTPase
VVNKVDTALPADVEREFAVVRQLNPRAQVIAAESPPVMAEGPDLAGKRVLVIDDGPTLTHGGMPFGAGFVAAEAAGAKIVDPRPFAVGSLSDVYAKFTQLGPVLPAMGYGDKQLADLVATINATPCDVVVTGTPIDLAATVRSRLGDRAIVHPVRHALAGAPFAQTYLGAVCTIPLFISRPTVVNGRGLHNRRRNTAPKPKSAWVERLCSQRPVQHRLGGVDHAFVA